MPCHLHLPAAVQAGSPTYTDAIPQRQSHTSSAGPETVSLNKVRVGEDHTQQYAQLWLPKANIDLCFHSQAQ